MLLGIPAGLFVFYTRDLPDRKDIAQMVSVGSDIFLRLIKMVIAPLVFCLLSSGIGKIGNLRIVGRIGGRAMIWFMIASCVSLSLGLGLMSMFNIGQYIGPPTESVDTHLAHISDGRFNVRDFVLHIFPKSVVSAMANNEILQVVVFAIFFGIAAAAIGERVAGVMHLLHDAASILLQILSYVMYISPVASFSAMFSIVAVQGASVLKSYILLVLVVFGGLLCLWVIVMFVGYLYLGSRVFSLVKMCKTPFLVAFGTSSSESAYPLVIKKLKKFGCDEKAVNFVLPLGYSFNLDASMMYTSIATLFIAQAYGIHLDVGTKITMLFFLLITSKGIAGVPRASLVIIAGALTTFGIPEAGLVLLLGVDGILDMGRSVTNIMGNTIATAVISSKEKSDKRDGARSVE